MNFSFRSVWNAAKQAYVAAAETVSSRGKPCSSSTRIALASLLVSNLLMGSVKAQTPPPAQAPVPRRIPRP